MKPVITLLISLFALSSNAFEVQHDMGTTTFDEIPKKVIALDWALTETVISLGVQPQGIADVSGYNTWVTKPVLAKSVIDVGSRREPNLELLSDLKPDVILISDHMSSAYQRLQTIAPVLVYTIYNDKKLPLKSVTDITRSLGSLLGKEINAEVVIEQTEARLKANAEKINAANQNTKPLMFIRFMNASTIRVHNTGSLVQSIIEKMGLKNDWQEETNDWGFTTAGIEKLAEHQKVNILIFGPLKDTERRQLSQSPLWQAMEFTRTHSVYELPAIWTFGGLISAQRFSDSITEQLTR
ncbi:iron-siderophore ABC transporter substrate-binding protein [Vibrio tetraodonis]|uniref:iron-siderophore ABC transporter substrate-binding protein n=1 Tax=Vibrio tetraodonis TaxID=2231647 RepID=UPI000E0A22C7|nr:iron-siderophore ABC transporter substrate-binding protein [Vibrio tetraodonis]